MFDCMSDKITDLHPDFEIGDKPSLRSLSHVLRNKHLWPEDFEWDYGCCEDCGVAMTALLWTKVTQDDLGKMTNVAQHFWIAGIFNMPIAISSHIFFGLGKIKTVYSTLGEKIGFFRNLDAVTPEQVADAIDAYLAT